MRNFRLLILSETNSRNGLLDLLPVPERTMAVSIIEIPIKPGVASVVRAQPRKIVEAGAHSSCIHNKNKAWAPGIGERWAKNHPSASGHGMLSRIPCRFAVNLLRLQHF